MEAAVRECRQQEAAAATRANNEAGGKHFIFLFPHLLCVSVCFSLFVVTEYFCLVFRLPRQRAFSLFFWLQNGFFPSSDPHLLRHF
jgi:hypothetical protein